MFQFIQHNNKIFLSGVIICAVVAVGVLGYATIFNYKQQLPQDNKIGVPQETPENSVAPNPPSGAGFEELYQDGTVILEKPLEDKSILMIVAFKGFEDKEYFTVKQYFLAAGVKKVLTASDQTGTAVGTNGGEATVNLLLKDVDVLDFDAVIFVGGPGASQYFDNENFQKVAKETARQGKLLSAISSATAILAKSGILTGKTATAGQGDIIEILKNNGVILEDRPVVRDDNIITGKNPDSSDAFALEIVDFLTQ